MSGIPGANVFFEDFSAEQEFLTAGVTVTEAHVVAWANLTGDWYPLHMDEEYAREHSEFGRRIVHGPFVYALAVGLVEKANVLGRSVVAWLGSDGMRATAPVFFGDTVSVRATVIEARRSGSRPDRGIVVIRYDVVNQDATTVLTFQTSLMIRARA